MADDLITLTRPQFENLMETQGLDNTVRGILEIANEELDLTQPLTLESLQNGTHPILDQLDRYKGLNPEQRQISSEEILTLFTNVQDYGKYDPSQDTTGKGKAILTGAGRMVPETVGAGAGFKTGLALATPVANLIPPIGLPGLAARGAVYTIFGIGGAISGALALGEAEDALIGEADPVVPSLEPYYRGGETGMIGLSMLATPWKIIPNSKKATTGALQYLETFKQISSGKFASVADEAFKTMTKNAGFSDKAAAKIFERATKARQAGSSLKGPMFSKGGLGINLGITRFNPAGFLVDPRKGPLSARILSGVEKGIDASMAAARARPKTFLGIEAASASGAGLGASVAQDINPYDEQTRFYAELLGSLSPTVTVELGVKAAPNVFGALGRWWGTATDSTKREAAREARKGILTEKVEKDAAERILRAIRLSEEYADEVNAQGNIVISADEKLAKFIEILGEEAAKAPDGLTLKDLAKSTGMPFSPTLETISTALERTNADLATATAQGREKIMQGSIEAIYALTATGDPDALRAAASITRGLFEQNIIDEMDASVTQLMTAASTVLGREADAGSARIDLSEKLYDVLKSQVDLSKVRERRLWSEVKSFKLTEFKAKNGRRLNQPNVLQLLDRPANQNGLRMNSKGAQKNLEAALGPYMEDINDLRKYFQDGEGRNPATAGRFFEMRSGLLDKAAELRRQGNIQMAKRIDRVADALLTDLTGQSEGASAAYNTARAYTFARNNVFTRSFMSELQSTDRNRGLVMDPSQLLDELFKGGQSATARRVEQIQNAGKFLIREGGFNENQVQLMTADEIMTQALQDSLSQVVDRKVRPNPVPGGEDIETFVVNENKLSNWRKQPGNKELLALLPDLDVDMKDARSAQQAFDNLLTSVSDKLNPSAARRQGFTNEQLTDLYKTKAFQWVLNYEDPGLAVANALKAEKPSLALNALYKMVDEADYADSEFTKEMAMKGLKSAIFNHALTTARGGGAGLPNGEVLQRMLFTQIKGVDPSAKLSLMDFMVRKGLVKDTVEKGQKVSEYEQVEKMVKEIRGVQDAFERNDFEGILFKNPSLSKMFYVRIAGATAGGAFQNKLKQVFGLPQMSGGLIAEQTGSELVQRFLLFGPESQRQKVMNEMFTNPKFAAELLKEVNDKQQGDKAMSAVEKFIKPMANQIGRRFPIGIRATEEAITEEYEPPQEQPQPTSPQVLPLPDKEASLNIPAQVPTLNAGPAPSLIQQASATNIVTPQPSGGPVDRTRYAAMFPNDPASALIRQGIGSMMG